GTRRPRPRRRRAPAGAATGPPASRLRLRRRSPPARRPTRPATSRPADEPGPNPGSLLRPLTFEAGAFFVVRRARPLHRQNQASGRAPAPFPDSPFLTGVRD